MKIYNHTQTGWIIIGIFVPVFLFLILGNPGEALYPGLILFLAVAVLVLLLFGSMTVFMDEQRVGIRFGIGIIRKHFALEEIESFRTVRNRWYYGWGIRYFPGGTLYNVSGLSAVELLLRSGKHVRIGTDEPEALKQALQRVLPAASSRAAAGTAELPRRYEKSAVFAAALAVVILAAVGVMMGLQMQPPEVRILRDRFLVRSAVYRVTVPLSEVTSLSIEQKIPGIRRRTNGFALGNTLRGYFRLEEIGNGRLFVNLDVPPFVMVKTQDDFVIVNFRNPEATRRLYEDLSECWARNMRNNTLIDLMKRQPDFSNRPVRI